MSGVNKAIIVGNLGADPELRTTPNGTNVCSLSVAVSEKYNGEEKTTWLRCVAFNKQAEVISQYLTKGSKIYIEGKISVSSYEKDGEKRYSTEIIVREFQFLDSRSETGNSREQAPAKSQPQQSGQQAPQGFDDFSDDIPFN